MYYSNDVNNLEFKKVSEHNYDIETMPWQIECNKLFNELGFVESDYQFQMLPFSKLKKIKDMYYNQSIILNEYGHFVLRNPIENYIPNTSVPEKELYSLGRTLGLIGDLGKYYYFLSDINFSRGFWLGSVEKAIVDDDYKKLNLIYEEIKLISPDSSEIELELIRKTMFDDKERLLVM